MPLTKYERWQTREALKFIDAMAAAPRPRDSRELQHTISEGEYERREVARALRAAKPEVKC